MLYQIEAMTSVVRALAVFTITLVIMLLPVAVMIRAITKD